MCHAQGAGLLTFCRSSLLLTCSCRLDDTSLAMDEYEVMNPVESRQLADNTEVTTPHQNPEYQQIDRHINPDHVYSALLPQSEK